MTETTEAEDEYEARRIADNFRARAKTRRGPFLAYRKIAAEAMALANAIETRRLLARISAQRNSQS